MRVSLVAASRGYSLAEVHELPIMVASLVVAHRLWGAWASVVMACGFSICVSPALEHRLRSCGAWA